ncbi:MAG: TetR/AcrR family transcriptional regulator [Bacteroidia bacterium]|nr:TetR/AcrR family transcriptional regulator [Bacteroidia bacterium]NND10644.1 TetR/AcrR family transcriptional regulator [Flavobacteriaceae bacterium]MBT8310700.1 TetR/AcrR family transcriptional regulator [Bacteroidia bacterium]NNK26860.1 TetR/AcrR family transcriptional regulator [Flavobacteriaceae bacterium]NNL61390.1 TetR/AcrR family transcriptional regulator [Flavobacteriaceae bacterium]
MKDKIITKSAELFLTLGFKSVTMDDIANELGISKKTIYQHFDNKTKLVESVTFSLFENICEGIDCIYASSNNPIEELYDIKMFVMKYLKNERTSPQYQLKKYYPKIFQALKVKQFDKMHGSVKESLQKGIDTQLFRSNIDVEFISRMYFNGMTGIKDETIFPKDQFTTEYLIESYLEYHLRAIVTNKGLKTLNQFILQNQSTI